MGERETPQPPDAGPAHEKNYQKQIDQLEQRADLQFPADSKASTPDELKAAERERIERAQRILSDEKLVKQAGEIIAEHLAANEEPEGFHTKTFREIENDLPAGELDADIVYEEFDEQERQLLNVLADLTVLRNRVFQLAPPEQLPEPDQQMLESIREGVRQIDTARESAKQKFLSDLQLEQRQSATASLEFYARLLPKEIEKALRLYGTLERLFNRISHSKH